jgi:hypothetical protein
MTVPKDSGIDWETAKALYHQGLNFPRIAERLGCNANTIRSRAHREQWVKTNSKSLQILNQEPNLDDLANSWRFRIQKICERNITHLETVSPSKYGLREFKLLNESLRIIDDLQRRNLKMDAADDAEIGRDTGLVDIKAMAFIRQAYASNPELVSPPIRVRILEETPSPAESAPPAA